MSYIDQLLEEDSNRRGFYLDFRSKYLMENEVDKLAVREEIPRQLKSDTESTMNQKGLRVDLSSKGLTSIHYAVYLTGKDCSDCINEPRFCPPKGIYVSTFCR